MWVFGSVTNHIWSCDEIFFEVIRSVSKKHQSYHVDKKRHNFCWDGGSHSLLTIVTKPRRKIHGHVRVPSWHIIGVKVMGVFGVFIIGLDEALFGWDMSQEVWFGFSSLWRPYIYVHIASYSPLKPLIIYDQSIPLSSRGPFLYSWPCSVHMQIV